MEVPDPSSIDESSPMADFWHVGFDTKKVIAYLGLFGAGPAFVDFALAVGPPWPHFTVVAVASGVWALLLIVFAYGLWRSSKQLSKRAIIAIFVPVALVFFSFYLLGRAMLCHPAPDFRHPEVGGFIERPQIKQLKSKTGESTEELFRGAECDPFVIWESWTVRLSQWVILMTWLIFYGSAAFASTALVLLNYGPKMRYGPKTRRSHKTKHSRRKTVDPPKEE